MPSLPQFSSSAPRRLIFLVLALAVCEMFAGLILWRNSREKVVSGFLIKAGNHYLVAWKRSEHFTENNSYSNLNQAIRFAHNTLNLEVAAGNGPARVEQVWLENSGLRYQVSWKMLAEKSFQRLTFLRRSDAVFFLNAFRHGEYSPSPFGHSILLQPISAVSN